MTCEVPLVSYLMTGLNLAVLLAMVYLSFWHWPRLRAEMDALLERLRRAQGEGPMSEPNEDELFPRGETMTTPDERMEEKHCCPACPDEDWNWRTPERIIPNPCGGDALVLTCALHGGEAWHESRARGYCWCEK